MRQPKIVVAYCKQSLQWLIFVTTLLLFLIAVRNLGSSFNNHKRELHKSENVYYIQTCSKSDTHTADKEKPLIDVFINMKNKLFCTPSPYCVIFFCEICLLKCMKNIKQKGHNASVGLIQDPPHPKHTGLNYVTGKNFKVNWKGI